MIVAACIRTADGQLHTLPKPARHADIERDLRRRKLDLVKIQKGFVDDQGRWLRRLAAAAHAIRCNQVEASAINRHLGLFSEDVW